MRFLKFADDMPNFSDVKDDIPIYRYFSYCKIKDFFEKEALWFCNATQFYDKLERRIPDSYFQNWDKEVAERYKSLYEMKKEDVKAYVSCWSLSRDNYALWKIYTSKNDGCAVATTVGQLRKTFENYPIVTLKVEYTNGDKNEENFSIPQIFFKHDEQPHTIKAAEKIKIFPYQYEQEVRFVFYSKDNQNGENISINLDDVVNSILISPFAYGCMEKRIITLTKNYVPNANIEYSRIKEKNNESTNQ